ncbi:MAG: hypothetical protein EA405_01410 [Rhodospirillales bacterium]|nr:MAG: hypothetical protein EA405_01410 [Rhodospirillales bacterium]
MAESFAEAQSELPESGESVSLADRRTPELVFAMVGPVASGVTTTANMLKSLLEDEYGYQVGYYKVSDIIEQCADLVAPPHDKLKTGHERTKRLQDIGNELRKTFSSKYLVEKCIQKIAIKRVDVDGYKNIGATAVPMPLRQAHIIDSVKHPEEVKILRDVYGDIFWLLTVFAPEQVRERRLDRLGFDRSQVSSLISRDEHEDVTYGQKVRDTSHLADFFVRNDKENDEGLAATLSRYLAVVFNVSVQTPTRDESAMYNAMAAASRSACLSRQVGAAIYSREGELLGLGWNDVPKAGGGLYGVEERGLDHRCYKWGGKICHNDARKEDLYKKITSSLRVIEAGSPLLATGAKEDEVRSALRTTDIRSLIEYSRAVHAEMEAIISVARGNKAGLVGSTLYSTTFPCHSCARHIVASGIFKVVYIEPYPKSLALDLHDDAISIDEKDERGKVVFLQYEGIAPKNMLRLFNHGVERKIGGKVLELAKKEAQPVFPPPIDSFTHREQMIVKEIGDKEEAKKRTSRE